VCQTSDSDTPLVIFVRHIARGLNRMELRGYEVGLSIRTLQRDIAEIERMFEIEIKNRRG
jgi:hypothetical protein